MKVILKVDGRAILIAPNIGSEITQKDLNNTKIICNKLNKLANTRAKVIYESNL